MSNVIDLPSARRIVSGRTFSSTYSRASFAAIERPAPKRHARDIAFGLAMAGIVALVLYGVLVGWIFGGQPA